MRLFFLEHSVDYSRYQFAYRPMLELESGDALEEVYARGFLPYSADPDETRALFYLARSIRWPLAHAVPDKKRRYDYRRFDQLSPCFEVFPKAEALEVFPADWPAEASRWMRGRFGEAYLSSARFDAILRQPHCTHLARVRLGDAPFAYVVMAVFPSSVHYWYAFFDPTCHADRSPGKWLMSRAAVWAGDTGADQFYVGTGYGPGAAYKVQGITGAEFFDGSKWNPDLAELRRRQAADGVATQSTPARTAPTRENPSGHA